MEGERKLLQDSLQNTADEVTAQLGMTMAKNTDLEKIKQVYLIFTEKMSVTDKTRCMVG